MTSLKLAKDFTGNDIYCNHLNVDTLTSGTLLDLTGTLNVQGNLAVTGNTIIQNSTLQPLSAVIAENPTTCAGNLDSRANTQICSSGAASNELAFFNGPGRIQVAGLADVAAFPGQGAAVVVAAPQADYCLVLNRMASALVAYGLLA